MIQNSVDETVFHQSKYLKQIWFFFIHFHLAYNILKYDEYLITGISIPHDT